MPDLSLEFPVLLGPVRVETRYTATHLLIRVFPDDWSVNKFEEKPTQAEVGALDAYWTALWASGGSPAGERAAREELVARVPAGRAGWLLQNRRPANPADRPTAGRDIAVLVIVSPQPVAAQDRQPSVTYWTSVWRAHGDRAKLRDADITLRAAVGPSRADAIRALRPSGVDRAPVSRGDAVVVGFLVLPPLPPNELAPQSWTTAAKAQLLPDRFIFTGYVGDVQVFSEPGNPVRPDLAVSPDPSEAEENQLKINEDDGSLRMPPKLLWLTNFGEAVEAGMGIKIPLEPQFAEKLDRLVVLGLREQAAPQDSANALGKLLTDQLRSPAGFSLLPQGTPTNNTEHAPAGQDPQAEAEAGLATAAGFTAAAEDWTSKTDGEWFAELLGLDPAVLAGVPNAEGTDRLEARAAHTALWPSTWGHYLQDLLTAEHIAETRKFFLEHVSGRGPLPAVKIGRQPYGILPTTVFSRLDWPDTASHRKALNALLLEAAQDWKDALQHVKFLDGPTTDVHQKLLDILALHPASTEYHFRDTESALEFQATDALTTLTTPVRDLLARLGGTGDVRELFADVSEPALMPVVDDRPLSEVDPIRVYTGDDTNYLRWLADYAGTNLEKIRKQEGFINNTPPSALLYLLARQAVLLGAATPDLAEQIDALEILADLPTARLERVFAEHIDAATYRLDAWRLGLVNERLAELRSDNTRGLHPGAYGWLENISRNQDKFKSEKAPADLTKVFGTDFIPHYEKNGGYIHAPSPTHARTAAVLRAGYLANGSKADANMFAVNLSSDRVRVALTIVDGMRQGQSLGALLGYRFERGLHDRQIGLDRFIAGLRMRFPLRANKIDETGADPNRIQLVEARNVINGLDLVRHVNTVDEQAGEPQEYPFGIPGLPDADPTQKEHIRAEVDALRNVNDALADLAVAEGVHQALQGNVERASATLDAYAKEGLPPEPAVVDTPRSGTTLTHRLGIQFTPNLGPDDGAPLLGRNNPRARAEPAVNAWLAKAVLPKPEKVAAWVTWKVPGDSRTYDRVVTQQETGLQAIDLLWALRPTDEAAMSDLDDRILGVVMEDERPRPDAEVTIHYTTRVSRMVTFFELSPLIAALRTLLTTSRPLRPTDLVPAAGGAPVSQSADDAVSLPRARPAAVLESLNDLVTEVEEFIAEPPDSVDEVMATYAKLTVAAGGFGLVRSSWGELALWRHGVYADVLAAVAEIAARMRTALEAADKILDFYDDDLPSSTPDDERFRILLQAERLLTTKPEKRPETPFRMRFNLTILRGEFASRLEDLEGLASTSETTLSGLLDEVAELLPLDEYDPTDLDLKPFQDRVTAYQQELLARAGRLKGELVTRRKNSEPAFVAYDKAVIGPDRVRAATDALKALLGEDVLTVPEFTPSASVMQQWRKARNDSDDLLEHLDDRDFPVDDWLHGMARVREMPRLWEKTVTLADALLGPGGLLGTGILGWKEPALSPIQLPYVEGDHWLGMEFAPRDPDEPDPLGQDRLLFTAHYASGLSRDSQCGLVFDEWTEVIPAERETTGIAVHIDRPDSEPPQAMLLVVPPVRDPRANWTPGDLIAAVTETFAMAKTRAVEPDHLDGTAYAHLLPAISLEGRP
ncbi:hypothetical protein [Kibdelosporangium aridum]|uniref:hypothetical protein n=1 Tax=Kibdelosporangium aridum TaxID=2030 RepID=UPI00068F2CAA